MVRLNRVERPNDLEFFIPDRIRVELGRGFHRDEAQKLHHVVLHHVAHGAGVFIIGRAPPNTDGFGHCDLNMVDILGIPEWLEQHVAEAHRHQVLHRFFPEVMVNPVNLALVEMRGQHGIEGARGLQVMAKGFLDHDPCILIRKPMFLEPRRQIREKPRADREIERPDAPGNHLVQKVFPTSRAGRIESHIVDPPEKPVQSWSAPRNTGLLQGRADEIKIGGAVHIATRRADETRFSWHLSGTVAFE